MVMKDRDEVVEELAHLLRLKKKFGNIGEIAARLKLHRTRLYQLAWERNAEIEKGGSAETESATAPALEREPN